MIVSPRSRRRDVAGRPCPARVERLLEEVAARPALVLFAPDAEEDDDGGDADEQEHAHHEEREDEFGA